MTSILEGGSVNFQGILGAWIDGEGSLGLPEGLGGTSGNLDAVARKKMKMVDG